MRSRTFAWSLAACNLPLVTVSQRVNSPWHTGGMLPKEYGMISKWTAAALVAGVSTLGSVQSAQADVTMTTHMTIHSPMMDKMAASQPKSQRDAMESMMNSTTYMSGKRSRVENAMTTMIIDGAASKMIMINPVQHTYTVMPFDAKAMSARMQRPGAPKPDIKVTDTGQMSNVLGHKCRHYIVDVKMAGNKMAMHADILAAQDIPGVDSLATQALTSQLGIHGGQVKGVPLSMTMTMTSDATGKMTMTQTATSVSTKPIPAAKFQIPAGFKKTAQPGMMGGPGMMGR